MANIINEGKNYRLIKTKKGQLQYRDKRTGQVVPKLEAKYDEQIGAKRRTETGQFVNKGNRQYINLETGRKLSYRDILDDKQAYDMFDKKARRGAIVRTRKQVKERHPNKSRSEVNKIVKEELEGQRAMGLGWDMINPSP